MDKIKIGDRVIVTGMERKHPDFNFRICKVKVRSILIQNGWTVEYEDENLVRSIDVAEENLVPLGCENIKDLEGLDNPLEIMLNLFNEYKGYYETICRIANGFSISEDNLRNENEKLHKQIMETEKEYQALTSVREDTIVHLRSEKEQSRCYIVQCEDTIKKLETELSARTDQIEQLRKAVSIRDEKIIDIDSSNDEFYYGNPITVAQCLVDKTVTSNDLFGHKCENFYYSKSELKQIAEHLMVYVNNSEDDR